jgi:hypothetical protein
MIFAHVFRACTNESRRTMEKASEGGRNVTTSMDACLASLLNFDLHWDHLPRIDRYLQAGGIEATSRVASRVSLSLALSIDTFPLGTYILIQIKTHPFASFIDGAYSVRTSPARQPEAYFQSQLALSHQPRASWKFQSAQHDTINASSQKRLTRHYSPFALLSRPLQPKKLFACVNRSNT